MVGIRQAAKENRWEDAARALSSAFSELDRERQITLVQFFFYYFLEELRKIYKSKDELLKDVEKVLNKDTEDYPWIVHLMDSQDIIKDVQYHSKMKKLEVSAFLTEAVWDMITSVQVKLWSDSDPEDFFKWRSNETSKGMNENTKSTDAARKMWNYVDKVLKAEPRFKDLSDEELYKDRPVVEVFEKLVI